MKKKSEGGKLAAKRNGVSAFVYMYFVKRQKRQKKSKFDYRIFHLYTFPYIS